MPESPMSASPYEVLGVAASVSEHELKRAFRRALRDTHPDTGGDHSRFLAVQLAWERIGTPERRAAYDSGRASSGQQQTFTAQSARPRKDTRPKARSHGHPGGWRRERFLAQMREWAGRGVTLDDPYDPVMVRSAPHEIRHTLADALAEEATARIVSELGIGYTVWHDVATGHPEDKLDHLVLGPTGLYAILSEDFGGAVQARKGELIGDAVGQARPVRELATRARLVARSARVAFSALLVVLPDDALDSAVEDLGKVRGIPAAAVRREHLAQLLRAGLPGSATVGGNELFELRSRIAGSVRFV